MATMNPGNAVEHPALSLRPSNSSTTCSIALRQAVLRAPAVPDPPAPEAVPLPEAKPAVIWGRGVGFQYPGQSSQLIARKGSLEWHSVLPLLAVRRVEAAHLGESDLWPKRSCIQIGEDGPPYSSDIAFCPVGGMQDPGISLEPFWNEAPDTHSTFFF